MFNSLQPLMPKEGEKDTIISSLPKAIEVLEKMQEMLETPDVKKLIGLYPMIYYSKFHTIIRVYVYLCHSI